MKNMTIQELFQLGMKRDIPQLLRLEGVVLNLGAGNTEMPFATPLDYPEWDATKDPIPYEDSSVDAVIAFHFLEHFTGEQAILILREIARVLRPGGTLTTCVPHRLGQMAYHDLDHKSFWCEETWRVLMSTPFYNKNRESRWPFEIGANFIIGLNERNLALLTQLIKMGAE